MRHKIKCYLGVRFSEDISNRDWRRLYDDIEMLSSTYKLRFNGKDIGRQVLFEFLKSEEDFKFIQQFDHFRFPWVEKVLIIQLEVEGQIIEGTRVSIVTLLEKRIIDLIIAISIARKGGLDIGCESPVFIDNKLWGYIEPIIHGIDRAYKRSKELKWPKIENLPLQKTIDWLEYFQNEIDAISTSKIGRALNAYSYLFKRKGGEGTAAELFWALVGLEALYVEGNNSLQAQVNLKSQMLLGERKENKKAFNEMYDFRSRFIHGDLNFINRYSIIENTEEYESHIFNVDDNEKLATAILIATFQKLIKRNWLKLEFEYKIKTMANI